MVFNNDKSLPVLTASISFFLFSAYALQGLLLAEKQKAAEKSLRQIADSMAKANTSREEVKVLQQTLSEEEKQLQVKRNSG